MSRREVLIGVSGGIAAFKTAALVSQLAQLDVGVTVVMTASAEQFVGRSTFAALSGRPVSVNVFDEAQYPLGAHIMLAQRSELLCIAPATANFLAKAATGLADDLLSTLYLCFRGPVFMAPAMNTEMWEKGAVQRNVSQLQQDGVHIIQPDEGWLSCRQVGAGRMASPERILSEIQRQLAEK